jgi:hypothetical protein
MKTKRYWEKKEQKPSAIVIIAILIRILKVVQEVTLMNERVITETLDAQRRLLKTEVIELKNSIDVLAK